ncbi:class A beta-lactamase [Amycolatopsis sp. CA-230715]|uniref:class A beta-lactamase n=1 Tax=Amycolatopsis sp. CA-230715 TaxID=2745196 RepID=UPI001C01A045|nr:class A beta-lactamase [Amycolatopsis sp. CA-230715]QWF79374.1 Beta-lactamase [Amycolatopsis sp. CA-230715]
MTKPVRVSRRVALSGALALALPGCAGPPAGAPAPVAPPRPSAGIDENAVRERLAALERKYEARLGVHATGSGVSAGYRQDERFALCSTFKTVAAAAVLRAHPLSYLDTVVRYTRAEVNSISPITQQHIGTGMTVRDLCDAAIRYSDGTAGNLLMRDIGGPAGLTSYFRGLGDTASRMDQYEPYLNRTPPGDPRDTSTPRAIAGAYQRIVLGDALPPEARALVTDWLRRSTTGANTIRAGVPGTWGVANKTGHGDYGRANDVAVLWPPRREPCVLAIMTDRAGYEAEARYPLLADAAKCVAEVLS